MNCFKKGILAFVLIFILLGFCLSCGLENKNENRDSRKDMRVLFIGNSHTFTNSMPKVLSRMSSSPQSKVVLVTPQYVHGGYTLQQHWQDGNSVKLIQKGNWDFVVLQENGDLVLADPNLMREYMSKFVAEVRKVNARPILFMTAAFQDKPQTTETIAELYGSVAKKLDAVVAPVALAYKNAMEKQPGLTLHNLPDKVHANELGTYLTACVFYSVITGQNPKGLPACGLKKVKQDDMQLLQQVAWETVRIYKMNRKK